MGEIGVSTFLQLAKKRRMSPTYFRRILYTELLVASFLYRIIYSDEIPPCSKVFVEQRPECNNNRNWSRKEMASDLTWCAVAAAAWQLVHSLLHCVAFAFALVGGSGVSNYSHSWWWPGARVGDMTSMTASSKPIVVVVVHGGAVTVSRRGKSLP